MISTTPNEGVPIIVLGLPSWIVLVLWLRIWYNTMLSSGEAGAQILSRSACRFTHRTMELEELLEPYRLGSHAVLRTENKCTFCEGERSKKESVAMK